MFTGRRARGPERLVIRERREGLQMESSLTLDREQGSEVRLRGKMGDFNDQEPRRVRRIALAVILGFTGRSGFNSVGSRRCPQRRARKMGSRGKCRRNYGINGIGHP